MNIDVVNKQVSKELDISERDVALINTFYWQKVKKHIYAFDPTPLNIENICVIYPDKWLLKKYIYMYLCKLRNIHKSERFIKGSVKHQDYINKNNKILRGFLNMRKTHKYTN